MSNLDTKLRDVSAILVAGGKSRRLGQDKRFIEIGGQTLFSRSLTTLETLFTDVIVVVADKAPGLDVHQARLVEDLIPDCGSLGGLYTGLVHAKHRRAFAIACDTPFLVPAVIRHLVELDIEADIVMPRLEQGLQPMFAVYSARCLPYLEEMAKSKRLRIHELTKNPDLAVHLIPQAKFLHLDPDLRSFCNINTMEDLERAKKLLAEPLSRS